MCPSTSSDNHAADPAAPAEAPEAAATAATAQSIALPSITHAHPGSFASLGEAFFTRLAPAPLSEPYLVTVSEDAARLLGIDPMQARSAAFIERFVGADVHEETPLASVYSGHQFGVWAGQLGDGRALLLGEAATRDGGRVEIQLKGSGKTPYSRMGDGRAVLRSSIREFLCSEAMYHLGIPTTRALAVIGSEQLARRETLETTAIVTRFAPSFVRFGHFEHFAALGREDLLARLADHIIERHLPACRAERFPYLALLQSAVARTAPMIAQWQAVGFCHGVMNTDNMSILGLTIDYGPFGFLDAFDAGHICNHTDSQGRYAYRMQPQVAYWNLFRLAQALLPILATEQGKPVEDVLPAVQAVLEEFKTLLASHYNEAFRAKLGLETWREGDAELLQQLFDVMQESRADFTLTFRRLAALSKHGPARDEPAAPAQGVRDLFLEREAFDTWARTYRARLALDALGDEARRAGMRRANPKFVLRNHLAEIAIQAAREKNFEPTRELLHVLRRPYEEQPEAQSYAQLPPDWAKELEVSCSS